jgi:hypothetical protein
MNQVGSSPAVLPMGQGTWVNAEPPSQILLRHPEPVRNPPNTNTQS